MREIISYLPDPAVSLIYRTLPPDISPLAKLRGLAGRSLANRAVAQLHQPAGIRALLAPALILMGQTGVDEKPSCSFSDRLEASAVTPVQRRPSAIGRLFALRHSVPPAVQRPNKPGRACSKSISASSKRRKL